MSVEAYRPGQRVRYFATPQGWAEAIVVNVRPLEWPWWYEYDITPDFARREGVRVQPMARMLHAALELIGGRS